MTLTSAYIRNDYKDKPVQLLVLSQLPHTDRYNTSSLRRGRDTSGERIWLEPCEALLKYFIFLHYFYIMHPLLCKTS